VSDDNWIFSKHALERALDMAIPAEELRRVLYRPAFTWPSVAYPGCIAHSNKRITLAIDPATHTVITVVWWRQQGERFERSVAEDLKRIRDDNT
jgi:hypothetical protein